jgi:hypothetical protein
MSLSGGAPAFRTPAAVFPNANILQEQSRSVRICHDGRANFNRRVAGFSEGTMNREHERAMHANMPAGSRTYLSADALLKDLDGGAGPEARAMATGYWMAIHDAESGYLTSTDLLKYLQAETGSVAELTGLGYVRAVCDCTGPGQGGRVADSGPQGDAMARREAARVKAWLEGRSATVMQPALTAVQLALGDAANGSHPRRSTRAAPGNFPGWFGVQPRAAKGRGVAAFALAMLLVGQQVSASRTAAREAASDLAVGRQAEYMTAMLLEQRRYEKDSIINMGDPTVIEAYARQWERARAAMEGSLNTLGSANLAMEDRQSLRAIRTDSRTYDQGYLNLLTKMREGRVHSPEDANRLLENYKPAAHRAEANGVLLATRAMQRLRLR